MKVSTQQWLEYAKADIFFAVWLQPTALQLIKYHDFYVYFI